MVVSNHGSPIRGRRNNEEDLQETQVNYLQQVCLALD